MSASLSTTPLHAWHVAHQARLAEFAGFEMPIQYASIVQEHQATRQRVTLFDISHMGRLRIEGNGATELLDSLLTRRVEDMRVGQVRYSLVTNETGGILDDILVSRLESPSGRDYYLLVVNASNRSKIVEWIKPHVGKYPGLEFHDVTEATAMIAVQGPKAIEICAKLLPPAALKIGYYKSLVTQQMSKPVVVSRTGYTGEDGLELIVRLEDANRVWENLMMAGREVGIEPAGLGARDTLRLEAGMPLYGHEIDENIDPFQAGLKFAVNLEGRQFPGRDVLEKKKADTDAPVRVGLMLDGRRAARQEAVIYDQDNRSIGYVTSGTFSPTLGYPIAMGYVAANASAIGTAVDVDIRGSRTAAKVVALPFYQRPK